MPKAAQTTREEKRSEVAAHLNRQSPVYRADLLETPEDSRAHRDQLRALLCAVKAVRNGDFSVLIETSDLGMVSEIGEVLNGINSLIGDLIQPTAEGAQ